MSKELSPIILALDTDDLSTAKKWIEITEDAIDVYKVCLLYTSDAADE